MGRCVHSECGHAWCGGNNVTVCVALPITILQMDRKHPYTLFYCSSDSGPDVKAVGVTGPPYRPGSPPVWALGFRVLVPAFVLKPYRRQKPTSLN